MCVSITALLRRADRIGLAEAALIFAAVTLGVWWPLWTSSGIPGHLLSDSFRALYPFTEAYRRIVAAGELPLWNPYTSLGAPFLAKGNGAMAYPLLLVAVPFGADAGLRWFVLLHVWLSGVAMFACAVTLGLGRPAAVLSGLVFMLNAHIASVANSASVSMLAAYTWMPAAFAAYAASLRSPERPLYLIAAIATLAMVVLAGYPQYLFYVLLAMGAYGVWHARQARPWRLARSMGALALAVVGAAALSGVLLVPMAEAVGFTTRSVSFDWDLHRLSVVHAGSYNPLWLPTLVLPRLFGGTPADLAPAATDWLAAALSEVGSYAMYVGVLPLMLAAFAVASTRRTMPVVTFLIGLTIAAMVLALGSNTPVYRVLYWALPPMQAFRIPFRATMLVPFTLSLLAGVGLHALLTSAADERGVRRRWAVVCAASAAVMLLVAIVAVLAQAPLMAAGERFLRYLYFEVGRGHRLDFAEWQALLGRAYRIELGGFAIAAAAFAAAAGVFAWSRWTPRPVVAALVALGCVLLDLGSYSRGYAMPTDGRRAVEMQSALLRPSLADPELHRVKVMSRPGKPDLVELNLSMVLGTFFVDGYDGFVLASYWDAVHSLDRDLREGDVRVGRLLNVKYVVSESPLPLKSGELVTKSPVYTYRIPDTLPRAFLVRRVRQVPDDAHALQALSAPDFEPEAVALAVGTDLGLPGDRAAAATPGSVRIEEYAAHRLRFRTEADGETLLVNSDMFYPGWRAYVDGAPAPLHRVNYTLRGVRLPPGSHDVELRYESRAVQAGLAVSGVGVASLGLATIVLAFRRRREDAHS
jgi:hypothetical protein